MLPSLFASRHTRDWNVLRAGCYGAGIGLAVGLLKLLGADRAYPHAFNIVAAIVGFAALCAGAAAVRNMIARRLIWPD
jgi:hypothetical protein